MIAIEVSDGCTYAADDARVVISIAPRARTRRIAWFKDPDGNILLVVKRNFAPAEEQVRSGHDQFADV
jgi:hypothetical protein